MKKLMTLFVFVLTTALMAPSCTSDETFEDVVEKSELDQSYSTDAEDKNEVGPARSIN